jgi:PAS domain S-box-containing protein
MPRPSPNSTPATDTIEATSALGGPSAAREAVNFLLSRGSDVRRESRRILIGIGVLVVIGVAVLNAAMYRQARERLERDGWAHLTAGTEARRDEVARQFESMRREVQLITVDPAIRARAARLAAGTASSDDRRDLQEVLTGDAHTLGLQSLMLIAFDGRVLFRTGVDTTETGRDQSLMHEALHAEGPIFGDPRGSHLVCAARIGSSDTSPVVVVHGDPGTGVLTTLTNWPGYGPSAGAYLVRREGSRALILTNHAVLHSDDAGRDLSLSDPRAIAPAMAATGIESQVDIIGSEGQPMWAVTRVVPGIGWGIVGVAEREEMMQPMRATAQGLILLDLALLLGFGLLGYVWRRVYRAGLERREIEITQRHAERVQAIFDTAFDAIFTFDRHGRIRTVNRAASVLFGRAAEDMDGQALQRFLTWGEDGRQSALPQPGSVSSGQALLPDGGSLPVEFSLGHTGEGDERVHTAIVRDVRERVESEKRIRAFAEGLELSNRRLEEMNAQLEEASRLKSEFLANTSHELRTPLNGMIGFLQLVLDGMCDSPDEERDFLKQALQCSRHLLGLINDVLDIAKIEAGKLTLEIDRIDMQNLFDEVYTLTHVQAAQKGVELRCELDVEPDIVARGDFGKVKQVLINLVGNSLKFTPRGSITIRAKSHAELGHFMVEVVDTGIGIPPERQKMIFEKFVQGDGSTTRRFGGTGLGLAISRSLVELMGGIIGVHSEGEGHGTRMYFSLPMWRSEVAVPDPTQMPAHGMDIVQGPANGRLVLIVEDDPVFRRFLTALLQQSGYRTVEADHAESGWMLLRRMRPDVVLLDYALSCGDSASLRTGWDLATRMTSEPETRHIPIVFVTGFDGELKEKLKATAFARRPEHLVKPVDGRVLTERIEALMGAEGGQRPTVLRVLMADDDPTVAAYIRKVLPPERYHVEVANNGEECLHILRTQPNAYDLLLLDLMMPEVSGYDVLREMTLTGIRPDLPVLVLTNFPEPRNEEERRLLEQGLVLDVVSKTSVHENPQLLPHVLDWHLQVERESHDDGDGQREAA